MTLDPLDRHSTETPEPSLNPFSGLVADRVDP